MSLRRHVWATAVMANNKAKRLAIRLTKWTGKSREYVHPKHLLGEDDDEQYWYLRHLDADDHVLDVGCGNGMHTLKTAGRCRCVAGIDRSAESLGVGRRTAIARRADNVGLVRGDVESGLPFGAGRFDKVMCLDLLEHVEKRDLVLGEIRRVLRAEGVLLLAVPNRMTSWKRRLKCAGLPSYSDPDHKIEYGPGELADELERNGFVIVTRVPGVYDTPLVGLVDVLGALSLALYRRLSALRRRLAARWPNEDAGFCVVCVPARPA